MGIKLMQGHLVMHVSTFLYLSLFIEECFNVTGRNADEYKHIQLLKYGHLVVAIMQTLQSYLKIYGLRFVADTLQAVSLLLYMFMVFVAQFQVQCIASQSQEFMAAEAKKHGVDLQKFINEL